MQLLSSALGPRNRVWAPTRLGLAVPHKDFLIPLPPTQAHKPDSSGKAESAYLLSTPASRTVSGTGLVFSDSWANE